MKIYCFIHFFLVLLYFRKSASQVYSNGENCGRLDAITFSQAEAPPDMSGVAAILLDKLNKMVHHITKIDVQQIERTQSFPLARVGEHLMVATVRRLDQYGQELQACFQVTFYITDVDECSLPPSHSMAARCHHSTQCLNTQGSYECLCSYGNQGISDYRSGQCVDSPRGWTDSSGWNCDFIKENAWCTAHGTHGSGWNLDWGTLAMSAVGGIDAFKACCACGGGGVPTANCAGATDTTCCVVWELGKQEAEECRSSFRCTENINPVPSIPVAVESIQLQPVPPDVTCTTSNEDGSFTCKEQNDRNDAGSEGADWTEEAVRSYVNTVQEELRNAQSRSQSILLEAKEIVVGLQRELLASQDSVLRLEKERSDSQGSFEQLEKELSASRSKLAKEKEFVSQLQQDFSASQEDVARLQKEISKSQDAAVVAPDKGLVESQTAPNGLSSWILWLEEKIQLHFNLKPRTPEEKQYLAQLEKELEIYRTQLQEQKKYAESLLEDLAFAEARMLELSVAVSKCEEELSTLKGISYEADPNKYPSRHKETEHKPPSSPPPQEPEKNKGAANYSSSEEPEKNKGAANYSSSEEFEKNKAEVNETSSKGGSSDVQQPSISSQPAGVDEGVKVSEKNNAAGAAAKDSSSEGKSQDVQQPSASSQTAGVGERVRNQEASTPKNGDEVSIATLRASAEAAFSSNEMDKAIQLFSKLIIMEPSQENYFKRYRAFLASRKYREALQDLSATLSISPGHKQALSQRAKLHRLMGLCTEAIQDLMELQRLDPTNTELKYLEKNNQCQKWVLKAEESFQSSDWEEAKQAVTEALALTEVASHLHMLKAKVCFKLQELEDAIAESGKVIKLEPENLAAYEIRGLAYFMLGELEVASTHFRQCLKYVPDYENCKAPQREIRAIKKYSTRGDNSYSKGEMAEAIVAWNSAIAVKPLYFNVTGRLHAKISSVYLELKDYRSAKGSALAAIKQKFNAHELMGDAHMGLEEWDAAFEQYQAAFEMEPTGIIEQKMKEAETALKEPQQKNYYKILGVEKEANKKEIKKAYKQLALQWHPDKHKTEWSKEIAEREFMDISEAYEVLSTDFLRERYERGEIIFEDLGGGGSGRYDYDYGYEYGENPVDFEFEFEFEFEGQHQTDFDF